MSAYTYPPLDPGNQGDRMTTNPRAEIKALIARLDRTPYKNDPFHVAMDAANGLRAILMAHPPCEAAEVRVKPDVRWVDLFGIDPGFTGPAPAAVLEPWESMALTVAWAQVQRGEPPTPNVASVCIATLARLTDRPEVTP